MSERGNFRGGRGVRGERGGGRGDRGSDRSRGGKEAAGSERKKENILDLTKYMDKEITVKFNGGREGKQIISYKLLRSRLMSSSKWNAQRLRSTHEFGAG